MPRGRYPLLALSRNPPHKRYRIRRVAIKFLLRPSRDGQARIQLNLLTLPSVYVRSPAIIISLVQIVWMTQLIIHSNQSPAPPPYVITSVSFLFSRYAALKRDTIPRYRPIMFGRHTSSENHLQDYVETPRARAAEGTVPQFLPDPVECIPANRRSGSICMPRHRSPIERIDIHGRALHIPSSTFEYHSAIDYFRIGSMVPYITFTGNLCLVDLWQVISVDSGTSLRRLRYFSPRPLHTVT